MIFLCGFFLLIHALSVGAMESSPSVRAMNQSPESSQISRGSELQMMRAEELIHEASSLSQIIKRNSAELKKNPEFKKVINRTELNEAQLKRLNERWDKKFSKLEREHLLHVQPYLIISTLFRKIMMFGFGMQAGYWLGAYPESSEREWFGASLGITAVGAFGYCYGKYQQRLIANCPPTRDQALALVNKKDAQSINQ